MSDRAPAIESYRFTGFPGHPTDSEIPLVGAISPNRDLPLPAPATYAPKPTHLDPGEPAHHVVSTKVLEVSLP